MVFMKRRDEGYPLAAMLVLSSMFAFALVFHTVTQPGAPLQARYDRQLAALALSQVPMVPEVPGVVAVPRAPGVPAVRIVPAVRAAAGTAARSGIPGTSGPPGTPLESFAWPAMPAPLPAAAFASLPSDPVRDGG